MIPKALEYPEKVYDKIIPTCYQISMIIYRLQMKLGEMINISELLLRADKS